MAVVAVTFVGTGVISSADSATNWSGGSLDTDSEVQNTGCIGAKVANATVDFLYDSSGAGVQDYSSGGAEEGEHMFAWVNCLTPTLDTLTNGGIGMLMGNGTDQGVWYVGGDGTVVGDPYKGGWKSFVVDPASDFDAIVAGTWTTGGNPAQLDDVDEYGGRVKTISTIMGNFNNGLVDQISVGFGLRVTDATVPLPAVFSDIADADEGTKANKYGVIRFIDPAYYVQGKIYIGYATGSAITTFEDTSQAINFENAPVAATFYEIIVEDNAGTAQTNCTWGAIASGVTSAGIDFNAGGTTEWALTIDLQNASSDFNAYACKFLRCRTAILDSEVTMQDCAFVDSGTVEANLAVLTDCNFLGGTDLIQLKVESVAEMANITGGFFSNCDRAIEITVAGTYTFDACTFSGNTFDVRNSSAGLVTIQVTNGGGTPTFENTGGGSVVVENAKTLTVTVKDIGGVVIQNAQTAIYVKADNTQLMNEDTTAGGIATQAYAYTVDTDVFVKVRKSSTGATRYRSVSSPQTITTDGLNVTITLEVDNNAAA